MNTRCRTRGICNFPHILTFEELQYGEKYKLREFSFFFDFEKQKNRESLFTLQIILANLICENQGFVE